MGHQGKVAHREDDETHALWAGSLLCNIVCTGQPKDLPTGHTWVAANTEEPDNITCQKCREATENWRK
jgi:hypothetical protein